MHEGVKIECISCRECFTSNKIETASEIIPERLTYDEIIGFAEDTGVEFDCPECGERQYLSDCEFF